MLNQLFFIITVSLFDSLSTTSQIIIFILILTTERPIRNSLSYLVGLSLAYFACGIAGYMVIDKLKAFLAVFMPSSMGVSDAMYYKTQIFMGVVFAAIGVIYYHKRKNSVKPLMENVIISRLKNMNVPMAFLIGVIVSVTGFPVSLPYIAALGKFAALGMGQAEVVSCLAVYNVFYALPMIVIFLIYIFALGEKEGLEDRMHERARKLNLKLTSAMFVGLGMLSVTDAMVYFVFGHPLFKNRYF
jgi:cytochrome c biogenesis protein CcdA